MTLLVELFDRPPGRIRELDGDGARPVIEVVALSATPARVLELLSDLVCGVHAVGEHESAAGDVENELRHLATVATAPTVAPDHDVVRLEEQYADELTCVARAHGSGVECGRPAGWLHIGSCGCRAPFCDECHRGWVTCYWTVWVFGAYCDLHGRGQSVRWVRL